MYIDLKKAFDTVDLIKLCYKTFDMGFRGIAANLIKTYVYDRRQCVCVNGICSDWTATNIGVPQGSVLGPIFYLLYIHSLKYANLNGKYFMCADDTVLVYSGENGSALEECVNSDLNKYLNCLSVNKLVLNVDKTEFMLLKQKNKSDININIHMNLQPFKKVCSYNCLGLLING